MNRKTFIVLHELSLLGLIAAGFLDYKWLFWIALGFGIIVDIIRRKTLGKSWFGWNDRFGDSYFDRFLK
ncbi:MAG: hypothetical protein ABJF11_03855 [Reichenbachiella sp.]|uniref:hypothetical protein n=1 Tax=Reichenbachiella sp. TaxID=2184521 RepID=UPI003262CE95